MARLLVVLLAAAPLAGGAQEPPPAAPAPPAAARPPAAREGVYVGAGLGVASGGGAGRAAGGGSVLRIRVGMARSPRLLVGFEGGLSRFDGEAHNTYAVGVTVFPWERYGFFRAAAGLTTRTYDTPTWSSRGGGDLVTKTEQGSNLTLGAGLALDGATGLNVSLNAELQAHWTTPSGSPMQTVALWLGLDWY